MAKPVKPDNRKTLTELRKAVSADDASHVRVMLRFFEDIARNNPQAVIDAFNRRGSHLSTLDAERKANQVKYYADTAEYLIELFDIK
jgi:hypothetical protein